MECTYYFGSYGIWNAISVELRDGDKKKHFIRKIKLQMGIIFKCDSTQHEEMRNISIYVN